MDLGFSGEMLFIFLLALLLFGPKKLPEIGRQVGRLLAEFRRASNELKGQLENEMRILEAEEQRKKIAPAPSPAPPEGTVASSAAGPGNGEAHQLAAAASQPGDLAPVGHDDDPPPLPGPGVESA